MYDTLFLILHFPILFLVLYGLMLVFTKIFGGLVISLIVGGGGLFALLIHIYFIKRGHDEFRKPISIFILFSMTFNRWLFKKGAHESKSYYRHCG